jgi:hypothetical protein
LSQLLYVPRKFREQPQEKWRRFAARCCFDSLLDERRRISTVLVRFLLVSPCSPALCASFEKAGLASALPNACAEVETQMLHLILPVVLEEKWPYL